MISDRKWRMYWRFGYVNRLHKPHLLFRNECSISIRFGGGQHFFFKVDFWRPLVEFRKTFEYLSANFPVPIQRRRPRPGIPSRSRYTGVCFWPVWAYVKRNYQITSTHLPAKSFASESDGPNSSTRIVCENSGDGVTARPCFQGKATNRISVSIVQ